MVMMIMMMTMMTMMMMMLVTVHSDKWANVSKQGFLFTDLPLQLFNQDWHHPTNKIQIIMAAKCQCNHTQLHMCNTGLIRAQTYQILFTVD